MRLAHFRVLNCKVIDDTEHVRADENVTALVGRNESGKTAILRALWKSRNVAGEQFDKLLDYPRARFSKDRKGNQVVTELEFALTTSEATELAALFPFALGDPPETVMLRTWYVGEDRVNSAVRFEERIEERCKQGSGEVRKLIEAAADALADHAGEGDSAIVDAKVAAVAKLDGSQPVWRKPNVEAVVAFKGALDEWIGAAAERAPHAQEERAKVDALVAEAQKGDPADGARKWATKHLPTFIYFDQYGQLETRIHLPTYIQQSKEAQILPRVRTQRALFQWSGIDPEEILALGNPKGPDETPDEAHRRLDKRQALLESASFELTGEWADWWIPDIQHRLHIRADGDYLVLNVADSKNPFQIPFEERSHGFQWFFSFYLVFLVESGEAHAGAILLLDEPGLHLHPLMQQKLIGFFDRVAKTNQVVYSTHLPFLVDGEHLDRVRTVYLTEEEPPRTVVSEDLRAGADRDTVFPLQAALGYSIAQTLFLGKRTLIVEGGCETIILNALRTCFVALGRDGLQPDTVLAPAGGIKNLMPLASIMYASTGVEGRRMLVLLDSDDAGTRAGERLDTNLFGAESRVLMLGDAISLQEATIEDLVPRAEYAAAAGTALGRGVNLDATEQAAPTNVAALARHWERNNWGRFGMAEKVATALHLADCWTGNPATVPNETVTRAQALFDVINARFP